MDRTPAQTTRLVGLATVGLIILVLGVLLVVVHLEGDPTDHLKERQPSPSPSSARQPR